MTEEYSIKYLNHFGRINAFSEYLLSFACKEKPKCGGHQCKRSHEFNEKTAKNLKETDEGKT